MPSSLTEVRSLTLGVVPRPTGVGLRYGQSHIWLEAFLGGLGRHDFRQLAPARARRHARARRIFLARALRAGSPACPFAGFMFPTASPLRSITMRSGCPGTLRRAVCLIPTDMTLLIPAFALLCAPPVLAVELLRPENAPLPSHVALVPALPCGRPHTRKDTIHGFGTMLEPRYVVGARALDQRAITHSFNDGCF